MRVSQVNPEIASNPITSLQSRYVIQNTENTWKSYLHFAARAVRISIKYVQRITSKMRRQIIMLLNEIQI